MPVGFQALESTVKSMSGNRASHVMRMRANQNGRAPNNI